MIIDTRLSRAAILSSAPTTWSNFIPVRLGNSLLTQLLSVMLILDLFSQVLTVFAGALFSFTLPEIDQRLDRSSNARLSPSFSWV